MSDSSDQKFPDDIVAAFAPGKPSFYCNVFNVVQSLHDIRIAFGKGNPISGPSYDAVVYLSHGTAKQLLLMLQDMITEYEREFGEIPLEPRSPGRDGE